MINCLLLIACLLFSFAGNLIYKLYNNKVYASITAMLYHTAISAIAGCIFSLLLSEFIFNPLLLICLSGIGGFLGIHGLTFILNNKIKNKFELDLNELIPVELTDVNSMHKKNNSIDAKNNIILTALIQMHDHVHLLVKKKE